MQNDARNVDPAHSRRGGRSTRPGPASSTCSMRALGHAARAVCLKTDRQESSSTSASRSIDGVEVTKSTQVYLTQCRRLAPLAQGSDRRPHRLDGGVRRQRVGLVPTRSHAALDRLAHFEEADEVGLDLVGGQDVEEGLQVAVAVGAFPVREDGRELDVVEVEFLRVNDIWWTAREQASISALTPTSSPRDECTVCVSPPASSSPSSSSSESPSRPSFRLTTPRYSKARFRIFCPSSLSMAHISQLAGFGRPWSRSDAAAAA